MCEYGEGFVLSHALPERTERGARKVIAEVTGSTPIQLGACAHGSLRLGLLVALLFDHLVALRAQFEECLGFRVEPGHIAIHNRLPDHAGGSLRTEVV